MVDDVEIVYLPEERAWAQGALAAFPGWQLEFRGVVTSTQDACRELAASTEHLVVVAAHQTMGRGRQGRVWHQEAGLDLSLSVRLVPRGRYPDLVLPLLFGAAVHRALRRHCAAHVRIKWPNDVLANERKIAGILIEAVAPDGWVAGAGINVGSTRFPPELAAQATSLHLEGSGATRSEVLATLLGELARFLAEVEAGNHADVLAAFTDGLGLAGQEVAVQVREETRHGILRAVTPDGVELADGRRFALGEVGQLRAAGG